MTRASNTKSKKYLHFFYFSPFSPDLDSLPENNALPFILNSHPPNAHFCTLWNCTKSPGVHDSACGVHDTSTMQNYIMRIKSALIKQVKVAEFQNAHFSHIKMHTFSSCMLHVFFHMVWHGFFHNIIWLRFLEHVWFIASERDTNLGCWVLF